MSVSVSYGQTISFSSQRKVCELPQGVFDVLDISRDGRFIVNLGVSKVVTSSQINVVTDWFEDLRRFSATEK